jgi:hypothetical protein
MPRKSSPSKRKPSPAKRKPSPSKRKPSRGGSYTALYNLYDALVNDNDRTKYIAGTAPYKLERKPKPLSERKKTNVGLHMRALTQQQYKPGFRAPRILVPNQVAPSPLFRQITEEPAYYALQLSHPRSASLQLRSAQRSWHSQLSPKKSHPASPKKSPKKSPKSLQPSSPKYPSADERITVTFY